MRKIKFALLLVLSLCAAHSQERKLKRALKLLSKSEYYSSREKINEFISENTTSPLGYFCLFQWFFEKNNPGYNPDSAYINLLTSESNKFYLESKDETSSCEDYKFCISKLEELKEDVSREAYNLLKKTIDADKIEDFIFLFRGRKEVKNAINYRDSLKLISAIETGKSNAIKLFIATYPNSIFINQAKEKLIEISFIEAKKINTESSYLEFNKTFPSNPFELEALKMATYHSFNKVKNLNNEDAYLEHMKNYPKSIYLDSCKKAAETISFVKAKSEYTEIAFSNHIKKYPKSILKDSAIFYMEKIGFQTAEIENTLESFESFMIKYPTSKYTEQAKNKTEKLLFDEAKRTLSITLLERFINRYPNSTFLEEAKLLNETAFLNSAMKNNSEKDYLNFLAKFPESKLKDSCIKMAVEAAYQNLLDTNDIVKCRLFLKRYPNSLYVEDVQNKLQALETQLMNQILQEKKFEDMELEELYSFYNSEPTLRFFYKTDTSMLRDQLRTILSRENRWGNYFDPNYFCQENYMEENKKISFNGLYIYDKMKSEFGCNCPDYSYGSSNYNKTSGDGSFCVIMDEAGKNYNPIPLQKIESTPISFILKVQEIKGKYNLFDTRTKKTITTWANSIENVFFDQHYFRKNTTANTLLERNQLFVGFKVTTYSNKERKNTLINTKGVEIIVGENYLDFYNGSHEVIKFKNCQYGVEYPSDYMIFRGKSNFYGVSTLTLEKEILPPIYNNIESMDQFNNLILRKYGNDKKYHSSIFNMNSRKFLMLQSDPEQIERVYVPFYENYSNTFNLSYGANYMSDYFNNENKPCSNIDYENDTSQESNDILYEAQNDYQDKTNRAWCLYNSKGQLLISGPRQSRVLMATDSLIHVSFANGKDAVIDLNGNYIWNPSGNYKAHFITPELFIYGYSNEQQNFLGLFSVKKGKVSEPIYENLIFTEDGIYGVKLGKKTFLLEGNY